ncbi:hypothetical protein ANN_12576 [Periplaneta americana]|uniref:Uncharacterized protein n=1 Tax=Periplaneta americana TaxID=6978 RepID=A0ABQ8TJN5_PERAM|nr:hypothetical protein ANN_12576 [Periplaneta americana]
MDMAQLRPDGHSIHESDCHKINKLLKNITVIAALKSERIPNLTGEQSDGITVFRIPPMTSLMLHRCRTARKTSATVVALIEDRRSYRYVAERLGASVGSVHRVARRFRETNSYSRRPGSNRSIASIERNDRFITLQVLRGRRTIAAKVQNRLHQDRQLERLNEIKVIMPVKRVRGPAPTVPSICSKWVEENLNQSNGQRVWPRNQVARVRFPVGASYLVEVFSGVFPQPKMSKYWPAMKALRLPGIYAAPQTDDIFRRITVPRLLDLPCRPKLLKVINEVEIHEDEMSQRSNAENYPAILFQEVEEKSLGNFSQPEFKPALARFTARNANRYFKATN